MAILTLPASSRAAPGNGSPGAARTAPPAAASTSGAPRPRPAASALAPRRPGRARSALAMACLASMATARAQSGGEAEATAAGTTALPPVTITAPAAARTPGIAGFGDRPIESLPLQATVIDREELDASGADRLADLTRFDAAVSDAYNSYGYWDYLTVRGYVLDPRFNYRREGLPISGETAISLLNKERVELLKGTSGIQAGTSAPGGLVNYVVKRPTAEALRRASLHTGDRGTLGAAIDLGGRATADGRIGYRLNLGHEDVQPRVVGYGHLRRSLAAFAGELRVGPDSRLEAEVEWSRQTGASLPGYSLLGDRLPAPRKPANLNNQPWSQPNLFEGLSGTLRWDQGLGSGWRWVSTLGTQRLKTDDRLAYAFGYECHENSAFVWCDRYGPEGEFDLYDFRSEGERRRTHALQSELSGRLRTGAIEHDLRVGLGASRLRYRMPRQASSYVGTGNISGEVFTPANPELVDEGTHRRERSLEFFANDAIDWGRGITTWVGLRHTRLHRDSVRTDGSRAVSYGQSITTPWLAASWAWAPQQLLYASWGRGAESDVVPNRARYGDRSGIALPVLRSRQWELGLRVGGEAWRWGLTWFDIDRPAVTDAPPIYQIDGSNRHRGLELTLDADLGPWSLRGGAMWIDAERRGASDAALNGQRPANVPRRSLKLRGGYQVAAVPGLALQAGLVHEGRRNVLPDGSFELPSWTRVDAGAAWVHTLGAHRLTWRAGIDNLFDRRAWKESPYQYGHVYLFPLEARTWRLSLQADF